MQKVDDHMPYVGPLIAQGATADIHAWGEAHVIKLFHPNFGMQTAEYEAHIARLVEAAGLDVPAVGEIIQFDERVGLVYERAEGQQALRVMQAQPLRLRYFAREMARLHTSIHAQQNDTLPSQKNRLRHGIKQGRGLTDATKQRLLENLVELPSGTNICHGDFHMENILLDGEDFVVIDWIDASSGHPMGDVARSYVLMTEQHVDTDFTTKLVNWGPRRWFRGFYLSEYFRLKGSSWTELAPWLPVVAAARLREKAAEGKNLVSLVHQWLDR